MNSHQLSFDAIGTRWVIDIEGNSPIREETILEEIKMLIEGFDSLYSRFREDSLVSKMAHFPDSYTLDDDGIAMMQLYERLYMLTQGAFTPLIGNLLVESGYDSQYSFSDQILHMPPAWEDVIELKGNSLTVKKAHLIDYGGIGKGYLIDKLAKYLDTQNYISYCIDGGGDIMYRSQDNKKIRVGLENPDNVQQVIGVAEIVNQSICASAGNKRKWGEFHHIMNPFTLKAQNSVKATWVIADNATIADSLATCLFFVEPEVLLNEYSFEYVVIYPDNSVAKSPNIPVEFY
jgi:thiamine biosynthesis lipoprotein